MPKGQRTRERIVAEAASLFNQRGFEGGSMSELMAATGLEKGGIYRHFSSKQELAAEAFDYAWKLALATRTHALNQIPNSIDKLKQFVANFADARPSIPGGCPLLNTAIDADDGNPLLRERARKALREWRDLLISIIDTGIKQKEIKRSADAEKLATLIISSLEGALMIGRLERDREALLIAKTHLNDYIEQQVRLRSSRR